MPALPQDLRPFFSARKLESVLRPRCWGAFQLLVLTCLVGCGVPPQAVDHWQLSLDEHSKSVSVVLPAHLNELVPDRDLAYELLTTSRLPAALSGRDLDFVMPHFWAHTELW